MIWNYLRIAYRNARRNGVTTTINVLGLALGVAACLLIATYVMHETSYDNWVTDKDQIFRLYGAFNIDGDIKQGAHFSANTAATIDQDFDEVISAARFMDNELFYGAGENNIRWDGDQDQHREAGFSYVDQKMLTMLDIPMVYGEARSALEQPKTVVISESKSKKYFGTTNPVGRTLYLNGNDDDPFTIGGVMQDFPTNSHLSYDFLITLTDVEFGEGEQTRWTQNNYFTYLKFRPDVDYASVEKRISDHIITEYLGPAFEAGGYRTAEELANSLEFKLQPMADIHLHSGDISDTYTRGNSRFVWLFGIVGALILLIAGINFVNLSTARSSNRAKEVGMRKVLGSQRSQLIGQFLSESVLITFVAFVIGCFIASAALPFFGRMVNQPLEIPLKSPLFLLAVLGSALVIGLLAGAYPSMYLSKFKPITVFRNRVGTGGGSSHLRRGLVVFQFTTSIALIAFTLVAHRQFNFMLDREVGYDRSQVIQLASTDVLGDQVTAFRDEIIQLPGVQSASISDYLPVSGTKRNGNTFYLEGRREIDQGTSGQRWIVDHNYIETLGLELLEGRNFPEVSAEDTDYVIVNEAMVKELNLESPIGKKFNRGAEILGVVKDFEYFLYGDDKTYPLVMYPGVSATLTSVKVSGGQISETIAALEDTWKSFGARMDFEYTFMDESFAQMYAQVEQVRTLFTGFAILAIFIACLGLFALSAFMVERRQKEMSIRKVLGASSENLFGLLTQQFFLLNLISLAIATPLAIYFIRKWLQDFSHQVAISWDIFAIATGCVLFLTLTTISYHALKTIFANPINALRDE